MQKNVWNIFCPVGSAKTSLFWKLAVASTLDIKTASVLLRFLFFFL